jgi:hypothetical protein
VRRWLDLVVMLLLIVAPGGPWVRAQEVPPVGVTDTGIQIDLAAMTLRPDDLDALGLPGFGLAGQSSLRNPEAEAQIEAEGDAIEAAVRVVAYRNAGFQYRYVASLLRPRQPLAYLPSGFVAAQQRINTSVTEFGTVAGAQKGFASLIGFLGDLGGRNIPRQRTFGDESVVMRSARRDIQTGERSQHLELVFRLGRFVGQVIIVDFDDVRPDPSTAERLGEVLLARITQNFDTPGPGLSMHVLRVSPIAPWVERGNLRDFYVRINNRDEVTFPQIVDAIDQDLELPVASPSDVEGDPHLPQATYMFWTPVGEGEPAELPLYVSWLDQYASPQQASAALRAVTSDLGPGYVNVRELSQITEQVGEESRAFAYHYEGDPAGTVRGHVVLARVGSVLLRLQVDGPNDVRRGGVEALAQRQAVCLRVAEPCVPVPVLQALDELLPGPDDA